MRVQLNRFPGGLQKCLTLSYDDGKTADRRLAGIMDSNGVRGSFHLNSGFLGDATHITKEEIPMLFARHEVSVHTVTHPHLEYAPAEVIAREILDDRKNLEDITGAPVRGMSYPFGTFNDIVLRMLPSLGIEYARTTVSHNGFSLPDDFLRWGATCHHKKDLLATTDRFIAEDPRGRLLLYYLWGHSYEFDNDNNWDLIESFCRKVGGRTDVWYATNIEICDYMKAVRSLIFSADGTVVRNPSAKCVWIGVDARAVEVPGGAVIDLKSP
ncbi:MAG: polysaccharide deacetylase family protein [Spirochaetota bacterium]